MNYKGKYSKHMEAKGTVKISHKIYKQLGNKIYITYFVSDDDSTTRKLLQPTGKSDGHLSNDMLITIVYADINHCVKGMSNIFFDP